MLTTIDFNRTALHFISEEVSRMLRNNYPTLVQSAIRDGIAVAAPHRVNIVEAQSLWREAPTFAAGRIRYLVFVGRRTIMAAEFTEERRSLIFAGLEAGS